MAIARFPNFVFDCPDPDKLADFYANILEWETTIEEEWVEIHGEGMRISFQKVEDYQPPVWPGQVHPQQLHLDVVVDNLDTAESAVLELGATKHEHQPGTSFRVFLDPAGHPFCLCEQ
ncbi:MAG: VOC family protein [Nocardioidaceae bacterium]|nr:MAG: VOC family protein [Nocardioidaceae bacterium]